MVSSEYGELLGSKSLYLKFEKDGETKSLPLTRNCASRVRTLSFEKADLTVYTNEATKASLIEDIQYKEK